MESNGVTVSVLVVTYNPQYSKLINTVESILLQKNVRLEIIISDDGSQNNYFEQLEEFFKEHSFSEYYLRSSSRNEGTVKNVYLGLKKCNGEYMKIISPGDIFVNQNSLHDWVQYILTEGTDVSFSNTFYYRYNDGVAEMLRAVCHPQRQDIYKTKDIELIKKYYLLVNDIANGAAVLCKRVTFEHYLSVLIDHVQYAEDNVYRIMIADNVMPCFFENYTIFYEYGLGVSTQKSKKWGELLKRDWLATDLLLLPYIKDIRFRHKFMLVSNMKRENSLINKIKVYLLIKERVFERIKKTRRSNVDYGEHSFINMLNRKYG